ncbi:MAG: indolepyruvate ferredoxin oxidoreductase subunit alpha [Coriobacteriales bacterium]|jgi:indolepyruvate ferredoxin oxidoreductase alpha subunit
MPVKLLMGNEALGLGALHAGVNFVAGYPGTPSTEVLETVAKNNDGSVHVEWSTNEKAALEAAAGAAYSGARALVTMKQVGMNVASDPLMTLSYLGVEGGLVIVVADDPGPISSQTEQDTRNFAQFAKVPVLDPSNPGEAYGMIQDAFTMSERYHTPVIVRPTTRVCHACGTVKTRGGIADCGANFEHADIGDTDPSWKGHTPSGFKKDTKRWVVFPRTSFLNHDKVERRARQICYDLYHENSRLNRIEQGNPSGYEKLVHTTGGNRHASVGIACGGVSYHYVREALELLGLDAPVLKIGNPYPFPAQIARNFMEQVDEVLVVEELDPVIELGMIFQHGLTGSTYTVHGKLDGFFGAAGEQSVETVAKVLADLAGIPFTQKAIEKPELPARPPVLCAGCPHRASFYAVKRAVGSKKAVFCGDIGCYTLGNAMPLDMVDTCLCMGGGITVPQGIKTIEPDTQAFGFVGDSTFFASGITGVINAVYNQHDIIVCILDNSTTAMTGHQPHPGTGRTMMGVDGAAMSIPAILEAIGVDCVTVDPLDLDAAVATVKDMMGKTGVRAIIFKSPCIYVSKPTHEKMEINLDACIDCRSCINQIGCPALIVKDGHVDVDASLCYGCNLCAKICPTEALTERGAL